MLISFTIPLIKANSIVRARLVSVTPVLNYLENYPSFSTVWFYIHSMDFALNCQVCELKYFYHSPAKFEIYLK